MAKQLFLIEVTDTFGGEANYSWVTHHVILAKSERGAINWLSRNSGLKWRHDGSRYNSQSCATCAFIDLYDESTHKHLRLSTDQRRAARVKKAPKIPGRRAASVKELMRIKDCTETDARNIRAIWHTEKNRSEARRQIDLIIGTYGVEFLGEHKRSGWPVDYCNAGDPYSTTIVFVGKTMRVACWADYVESGRVKTGGFA